MTRDKEDDYENSPTGRLTRRLLQYKETQYKKNYSSISDILDADFSEIEERILAQYGGRASSKDNTRETLLYGYNPLPMIMDDIYESKPSGWEPEKRSVVSLAPKMTPSQKEKLRLKRKKERQNKKRARNG